MSVWREAVYKKANLGQELNFIMNHFERGTIIVYKSVTEWIMNEPHQTSNTDNIIPYVFGTIYASKSIRDLFNSHIETLWINQSDDSTDFEIILGKDLRDIVDEHVTLYTFEKGSKKLLKHPDCVCYARVGGVSNQVVYYTIMPDKHELVISDTPGFVTSNESHTCFNVWMHTENNKLAGELIRDAILSDLDEDILKYLRNVVKLQEEKVVFSDRGLYNV